MNAVATVGVQPNPPKKLQLKKKTLGEWGQNAPVGSGDGALREFSFRHFNMKVNRLLGEVKEKGKGLTFGKFVTELLCVLLTSVSGEAWDDKLAIAKKKLTLATAWAADVLYMYFSARVQAMGSEIKVDVTCPACNMDDLIPADLGDLDVYVSEVPGDMTFEVDLRDGLRYHGTVLKRLRMQPLRWNVMESSALATSGRNDAKRDAIVIIGSVIGAEGHDGPLILTDADLDELSKYDLEAVKGAIEANAPGPQVVVSPKCSACGLEFRQMINWEYERFFNNASPSRNGTK